VCQMVLSENAETASTYQIHLQECVIGESHFLVLDAGCSFRL
jgi:hypothetical protein